MTLINIYENILKNKNYQIHSDFFLYTKCITKVAKRKWKSETHPNNFLMQNFICYNRGHTKTTHMPKLQRVHVLSIS